MQLDKNKTVLKLFGEHVRLLRKTHGLSQEDLALSAGLDRTYLGGVERGERNVSLINIEKIANALEVTLAELLNFERR